MLRLAVASLLPTLVLTAWLLWLLHRQCTLTQRREKELGELSGRVRVLHDEIDTLSYTVSHELRAPVHVIRGFVDAVLSGQAGTVDHDARRYLDRVQRSAARMDQLMTDLIALSRLWRETPHCSRLHVQATATKLTQQLQQRHAGRLVECDVRGDTHIDADPRLFETMVDSLIDNAAKFSPGPGPCRVEVHSRCDGDHVVIEVADRGVGFPAELSARLFRPFQRLHANGMFPGAGMGLAMAARIARLHGGTIEGRNRAGGGAVFEVRMPRQQRRLAAMAGLTEAG